MRIVLDIRPLLSRSTGVGVLFRGLITELAEFERQNSYLLFTSSLKERPESILDISRPNFQIRDSRIPVRVLNFLWHNLRLPAIENFVGPVDVAHSPHPLPMPTRKGRQVVTIHDLHFLSHPDEVEGEIRRDYVRLVRRSAERADLIQTISEYSKQAIISDLGVDDGKIRVIGPGITFPPLNGPAETTATESLPPREDDKGKYFLFVGSVEPRKNLPALLRAMAGLKEILVPGDLPSLKVVGGGRQRYISKIRALVSELDLEDSVQLLGFVDQQRLHSLYDEAVALTVPSSTEGFCIPLLEAMSFGTPVIASPVSAIPEVAGEAALYVNVENSEEYAEALRSILHSKDLRDQLIDRGHRRCEHYSWRHSAESLLLMYEELGG